MARAPERFCAPRKRRGGGTAWEGGRLDPAHRPQARFDQNRRHSIDSRPPPGQRPTPELPNPIPRAGEGGDARASSGMIHPVWADTRNPIFLYDPWSGDARTLFHERRCPTHADGKAPLGAAHDKQVVHRADAAGLETHRDGSNVVPQAGHRIAGENAGEQDGTVFVLEDCPAPSGGVGGTPLSEVPSRPSPRLELTTHFPALPRAVARPGDDPPPGVRLRLLVRLSPPCVRASRLRPVSVPSTDGKRCQRLKVAAGLSGRRSTP